MLESLKDAFSPIPVNFNWEFIGTTAGLILAIWGIYYSKKIRVKKKLRIKQCNVSSALMIPEDFASIIAITYNNEQINNLFIMDLYLQNAGNETLKLTDFNNNCIIGFSNKVKVKSATLSCSDTFTKGEIINLNTSVEVIIELLEPKTYLKVTLLYVNPFDDQKGNSFFKSNIIGGEKNQEDLFFYSSMLIHARLDNRVLKFLILTGALGYLTWKIMIFIIKQSLNIEVINNDLKPMVPVGWYIVTFIPSFIVIVILFFTLLYKMEGWMHVKNWKELK